MRTTTMYVTTGAIVALVVTAMWFTSRLQPESDTENTAAQAHPSSQRSAPVEDGDPADIAAPRVSSTNAVRHTEAKTHAVSAPDRTSQGTHAPLPIDVSPGFEHLLAPAVDPKTIADSMLLRWHRRLAGEERDEAWATHIELGIRDHIEKSLIVQGLDARRVELVIIECRTTGCEIQTASPREDNAKPKRDPQLLLQEMIRGPLAADFESRNFLMRSTELPDGRLGHVAFLSRKQP